MMTRLFTAKHLTKSPLLILLLLLLLASPALAQEDPRENPLTIVKAGFLDHFENDHVVLTNMETYRRTTFRLAPEVRYTRDLYDISRGQIFVGSIINIFLLDGVVVEIELIQESS